MTLEIWFALLAALLVELGLLLVCGFFLFTWREKKKKRIEIFFELARMVSWIEDGRASKLLSSIPFVFNGHRDHRVKVAYSDYRESLNSYTSAAAVVEPVAGPTINLKTFPYQGVYRKALLRELAVASGWSSRAKAADFDFSALISLAPQGKIMHPDKQQNATPQHQ